jgi:hypothetical protein
MSSIQAFLHYPRSGSSGSIGRKVFEVRGPDVRRDSGGTRSQVAADWPYVCGSPLAPSRGLVLRLWPSDRALSPLSARRGMPLRVLLRHLSPRAGASSRRDRGPLGRRRNDDCWPNLLVAPPKADALTSPIGLHPDLPRHWNPGVAIRQVSHHPPTNRPPSRVLESEGGTHMLSGGVTPCPRTFPVRMPDPTATAPVRPVKGCKELDPIFGRSPFNALPRLADVLTAARLCDARDRSRGTRSTLAPVPRRYVRVRVSFELPFPLAGPRPHSTRFTHGRARTRGLSTRQ